MALKDVIARVKAKQEEKHLKREQARVAKLTRKQSPPREGGNAFSEEEIDVMESARDAHTVDKNQVKPS
jgi:hypothetical protein